MNTSILIRDGSFFISAETLTPEKINRRTDDVLFEVKLIEQNIDRATGKLPADLHADLLQNAGSDVNEADVHDLAMPVYQVRTSLDEQYQSLGRGTIENCERGIASIDVNDHELAFEGLRRMVEKQEEAGIHSPERNQELRKGKYNVVISSRLNHDEADVRAAIGQGYDDRSMIRIQTVSEDGLVKMMRSYTVFDTDATLWARVMSQLGSTPEEATSLAVLKASNELEPVEAESEVQLITDIFDFAIAFSDDQEVRESLMKQRETFTDEAEQIRLYELAMFYAQEKVDFEIDLALSGDYLLPGPKDIIETVYEHLNENDKRTVDRNRNALGIRATDEMKEMALKLKIVTLFNRAGIAAGNTRTLMRAAHRFGNIADLVKVSQSEKAMRENVQNGRVDRYNSSANEVLIARANLDCGGGCSLAVEGMFQNMLAATIGMVGNVYQPPEYCCPRCTSTGVVIFDKHGNKLCTSCGDFDVDGEEGNIKMIKKEQKK